MTAECQCRRGNLLGNTRDALYGCRPESMCLHSKARENETISYVDVKYFKFAFCRAIIQVGNTCKGIEACLRMDDLIICSIVLREILYHHVFPSRCNNKFIFCLCRTCVLISSEECVHTQDEDHTLTGTWVMVEMRLAVEMEYRILDINDVYVCQVTQYNPERGEGGRFVFYINTFIKLKRRLAVIAAGSTLPKARTGMWTGFGREK